MDYHLCELKANILSEARQYLRDAGWVFPEDDNNSNKRTEGKNIMPREVKIFTDIRGNKYYTLKNVGSIFKNERHREDGPAIDCFNGHKEYYIDGVRHRIDGPAVMYADGRKLFYINGDNLTEDKWKEEVSKAKGIRNKE